MNYSMEEINLMCIYDCTSRSALIGNLEEAAEYRSRNSSGKRFSRRK